MSYLLAVGDSWTDENYKSYVPEVDCSFTKWPTLLAHQLKISEVVNLGLSGGSNTYIFNSCYDKILEKRPELVCILLSQWDRQDTFNFQLSNSVNLHAYTRMVNDNLKDDRWHSWIKDYCDREKVVVEYVKYIWETWATLENVMNNTLRSVYLFKSFCEKNDIKYIILQGVHPIDETAIKNTRPSDERLNKFYNYLKYMLVSPYAEDLNDHNMIGWPYFWQIGGYSMSYVFESREDTKLWLHERDQHPSSSGHELIADYFYKGYKNVYS